MPAVLGGRHGVEKQPANRAVPPHDAPCALRGRPRGRPRCRRPAQRPEQGGVLAGLSSGAWRAGAVIGASGGPAGRRRLVARPPGALQRLHSGRGSAAAGRARRSRAPVVCGPGAGHAAARGRAVRLQHSVDRVPRALELQPGAGAAIALLRRPGALVRRPGRICAGGPRARGSGLGGAGSRRARHAASAGWRQRRRRLRGARFRRHALRELRRRGRHIGLPAPGAPVGPSGRLGAARAVLALGCRAPNRPHGVTEPCLSCERGRCTFPSRCRSQGRGGAERMRARVLKRRSGCQPLLLTACCGVLRDMHAAALAARGERPQPLHGPLCARLPPAGPRGAPVLSEARDRAHELLVPAWAGLPGLPRRGGQRAQGGEQSPQHGRLLVPLRSTCVRLDTRRSWLFNYNRLQQPSASSAGPHCSCCAGTASYLASQRTAEAHRCRVRVRAHAVLFHTRQARSDGASGRAPPARAAAWARAAAARRSARRARSPPARPAQPRARSRCSCATSRSQTRLRAPTTQRQGRGGLLAWT